MELEDNPTHKVHRKSKVGVKAEKKKAKKQKNNDIEAQRERNPKVRVKFQLVVTVGFHPFCQVQKRETEEIGQDAQERVFASSGQDTIGASSHYCCSTGSTRGM